MATIEQEFEDVFRVKLADTEIKGFKQLARIKSIPYEDLVKRIIQWGLNVCKWEDI